MINRVTIAMFILCLLIASAGVGIVWLGMATNAPWGAVIGLAWVAFGGFGSAFAWKTRYDL